MEKMSCIKRVLLFVLSFVVFVMLPVYSAKAETHYILTEDGALVEDTHAERTQVVPHVMGINVAAQGSAPTNVKWHEGWTTGVMFDREANKYYKLKLYCSGAEVTTVTIPSESTSGECFVPVGVRFESRSYGEFTATVYEADSSGNIISGGTSTAVYEYIKPSKKVGTPSNLVWNGPVLSWSASSDMTGVKYMVYKKSSSSSTGNSYLGERTVENINNSLDLSDFFEKYGEGEYKVHLYAITNMNKKAISAAAISGFQTYPTYPSGPVDPVDPVDPTVAHTITILNDGNGKASSLQQSAVKGAEVTIYVNAPNTGYEFDKWIVESGGITLDDPAVDLQTFTMQSENVVIRATFKLKSAATYGINVTNDGHGTGTTNKNTAATGDTVTITASPSSGYKFKEWQVVSGGVTLANATANPTTFKMGSSAVKVKAVFEKITYGVTVSNDSNGTGKTDKNSAATGETVKITATPSSGYKFKEWKVISGGVTLANATANPTTFTMGSSAVEVKAVFEKITYGVTVSNDSNGTGKTDKNSAATGETVTITATPSSGYKFKEWQVVSGGVTLANTTANPTTFKMGSSAVKVKAVFEKITYGVTVSNDSNGTGKTDKNSAATGETVKITATPSSGYKFKEWKVISGGVTLANATANPTTFTMGSSAVEVKAVFEKEQVVPAKYGVTVTDDGHGTGTTNKNSAATGETVTITATASNGYKFKEWQVVSGGVTLANATANPTTFTMGSSAVEVKAVFEKEQVVPTKYGVTVTDDSHGTGTTNKNSAATGETVTITATPSSGYKFKEWQVVSGGVTLANTTANPTTFTMGSKAVEVKAVFEKITYGVTVSDDDHGTGKTDKNSAATGETVKITATPSSGYKFKEWKVISGGVTLANATANPTTFTMGSSAVEVKAVFEKEQVVPATYTITVTTDGHGTAGADKDSVENSWDAVNLTATPYAGYKFKKWVVISGATSFWGSQESAQVTIGGHSGPIEIMATFELDSSVPVPTTYGITVTDDGHGTGKTDKNSAATGETVTITATPSSGYKFKEWQVVSGGVTLAKATANPTTFTMGSSAVEVKAVFEKEQVVPTKYGVTVSDDGHGTGTTDKNTAATGETVTITAIPSSGYKFKEWQVVSGGVTLAKTTANPTTFKMGSKAVEVKAVFEKEQVVPTTYGVTVTDDGHGTGTTDKNSAATGETVKITATPSSGYKFKEWKVISGGVTLAGTTANPTTFKMGSSAVEVKAVFEKEQVVPAIYTIKVTTDGHGTASADKTSVENSWDSVNLTATPDAGYKFKKWVLISGETSFWGSQESAQVTIGGHSGPIEVMATFEKAGGQADEGQIKAFVERLYNNILGRPGDEAGVASWVKLLVEGTQNGASVSFGFVFSDEFGNRGLSNEAKVEILYNTFLNRTADDAGKKMWTDALDAGVGIEKIFEGFVMSDEFAGICSSYGIEQGTMNDIPGMTDRLNLYRNRNLQITEFVSRCYTKALGRERDIDGVEMWCRLIINKEWTPRNVAADGFFHSDEFINKNTTNSEYVAILYRTFLGRELDNDGYELWVGLLNRNEWTRDQVLDGFADSEEFGKILAGFGLN